MCLFAMTIPDSLFLRISHFDTAREVLLYLPSLFEKTTTTTTTVHDTQHGDTTRVAACSRNEVRNGSRRQQDDSPKNGMRHEHECTTTDQGKVEMKTRVAEKGAKSRGRVDEEEAAAPRGPGTVTTARTTDGVSLATPASGPTPRDDNVALTEKLPVESEPPLRKQSNTTQPIWMPHDTESNGEGQGMAMGHREATGDNVESGKMNDEEHRAHGRVDDEDSRVETSEDKTTTVTPDTPPRTPLEGEWIGKTSGGGAAWTAHETNWPTRYSTSARGTSRDHPDLDEDVETRSPTGPLEDPGDAMDDDARHPDEPTEPPDDAESTRVRGGEERVEERVEVDPGGGETDVERDVHVARENADATVDKEVVRTHGDARLNRESTGAHRDVERVGGSGSTHIRSTRRDEENRQRTSTDEYDAPKDPPDPFPPPDRPVRPEDKPPSVELEGEWDVLASCNVGLTRVEAYATGVPDGDEDPRNRPKGPQNASERERARPKGRNQRNPPEGGLDDQGDPSGEAHASGASGHIEDGGKWPRKLQNASERVRERSERSSPDDSPERA